MKYGTVVALLLPILFFWRGKSTVELPLEWIYRGSDQLPIDEAHCGLIGVGDELKLGQLLIICVSEKLMPGHRT